MATINFEYYQIDALVTINIDKHQNNFKGFIKFIPGQNFSKNQIIKAVNKLRAKSGR